MYQSDRGTYRKNESMFKQFRKSCLGKLVITSAVLLVLLLLAWLTNPSEQKMQTETLDNIRQSIESRDSIEADWMDIFVSNIGNTFSSADGPRNEERWKWFFEISRNKLTYEDHTFFSTCSIINHTMLEPEVCSFGVFGLVIPTVNFNRFLLRDGPLQDKPGKQLIQTGEGDEYMGETPGLGPYRNPWGE